MKLSDIKTEKGKACYGCIFLNKKEFCKLLGEPEALKQIKKEFGDCYLNDHIYKLK